MKNLFFFFNFSFNQNSWFLFCLKIGTTKNMLEVYFFSPNKIYSNKLISLKLKKNSFKRTREESLQSQITISSSLDRLQNIRRTKFWISDSFVYATSQNLFNIMENWLKNLSTKSRKYDTLKTLIFEIINEMNRVLMKKNLYDWYIAVA